MAKRKTLLIGWDAADWQIINPLLDAGKMPALASIIDNGVMGNIATLEPVISPILWNSIASGKTGDKHGVLGFTEASGMSGGVRPVMSHSRKTKAIWNILQQNDYKCHQIGWWATHPAEPLNGSSVSNMYGDVKSKDGRMLMMQPGTVFPQSFTPMYESFRIPVSSITQELMRPFVPKIEEVDYRKDNRLTMIARSLAECTNYHSAATYTMENEEWDFLAIYQKAIDTICHGFMKYHPPKLDFIPEKDYELYKGVVEGFYIYHDMMLGRLLQLAGSDATVIIISDHGFQNDERRNIANPKEPAGIAYDHRQFGVFCARGPGIAKDELVYGASLLDVTPTILAACGLPLGKDMDGKVLSSIFAEQPKIEYIDSWDSVEGNSGFIGDKDDKTKHFTTKEELRQLVDLGYIEDPGDNVEKAVESSSKDSRFNLARIYQHSRKYDKAIALYEELISENPDEYRFHNRLASVYQLTGEYNKSQEVVDELRKKEVEVRKEIEKLKKEFAEKVKRQKEGKKEEEQGKEQKKMPWSISLSVLNMIEANNLLGNKKYLKAIEMFDKLEGEMPNNARINIQKAKAYSHIGNFEKTIEESNKCLTKDDDNTSAHLMLATGYLELKDYENAADSALEAIGGIYFLPKAHFILGKALYELADYKNASQALEVCLHQHPGIGKARNLLIDIYTNHIVDEAKAEKHKGYFTAKDKDSIIIVSGIPRSGTSAMMQMLDAAGFDILTDKERKADESNPKGYYEYEPVKSIATNQKWLPEAKGKVVKVVSQLLFHLPDAYNYKVIFMNRDVGEVIASQQKMISVQKNVPESKSYPTHLEIAYKKNIERVGEWHSKRNNVEFINIEHSDLFTSPSLIVEKLEEFMGKELDKNRMEAVIDPSLHRSKVIT